MPRCGATGSAWTHFSEKLGLRVDLLPVVSNLDAVIADNSTLKSLGKTPSRYNAERHAVGIGKWTARYTTGADIAHWRNQDDYGICVQTRNVRAFDIDVDDPKKVAMIEHTIWATLDGLKLPRRWRENSGKVLLPFRYAGDLTKRVIPVHGGIVEILATGQQFIASGQHSSGVRYQWDNGAEFPEAIPELTESQFSSVWETLCAIYATDEPRIAGERRERHRLDQLDVRDDRADWLAENWETHGVGNDGQLFLTCPFEAEHTNDTGITSTAYFPAGTGGFERGHWACLHAHCAGRKDNDFDHAVGFIGSSFEALPPETVTVERMASSGEIVREEIAKVPWPKLDRTGTGKPLPTLHNLQSMLGRPDIIGMYIAWDDFNAEIMKAEYRPGEGRDTAGWVPFGDEDYFELQLRLERMDMVGAKREAVQHAARYTAREQRMDTAKEWLSRLRWDGTPRVSGFLHHYFGVEDSEYARAVSRYVWTAHAGRIIDPGVQADMASIFKGEQGARKTAGIKAMAPSPETYVTVNLGDRDTDLSRLLRGKLVGELEELRGLNSRDAEGIKAWVSRTEEEWVPKFREFAAKFKRRLLLHGSTNETMILADSTGERRWLPNEVGVTHRIRVSAIERDCEQLWAEGAFLYACGGVDYHKAEKMASGEHHKFKLVDPWATLVLDWAKTPNMVGRNRLEEGAGFSTTEVLQGAVGMSAQQIGHTQAMRMRRVLIGLNLEPVSGAEGERWYER